MVIFTNDQDGLRLSFLPVWIGECQALGRGCTTRQSTEWAVLTFVSAVEPSGGFQITDQGVANLFT
jgi:hypothetical protein